MGKGVADIKAYTLYAKLESLIMSTQKKKSLHLISTNILYYSGKKQGQTDIATKPNNKLSISFSKVYVRIVQYSLTPNWKVQS